MAPTWVRFERVLKVMLAFRIDKKRFLHERCDNGEIRFSPNQENKLSGSLKTTKKQSTIDVKINTKWSTLGLPEKKILEAHLDPNLAQLGANLAQLDFKAAPKLGVKIWPTRPMVSPRWLHVGSGPLRKGT